MSPRKKEVDVNVNVNFKNMGNILKSSSYQSIQSSPAFQQNGKRMSVKNVKPFKLNIQPFVTTVKADLAKAEQDIASMGKKFLEENIQDEDDWYS